MKECPHCKHDNPLRAKFCNNCGTSLQGLCATCGTQNPADSNFCMECGTKMNPQTPDLVVKESPKTEATGNQLAERRQLTVLFCDLVGSTPLSEKLDAEEYRQVIMDYHHLAEKVIKRFGGHIAQYLGDGLLVYFGYPVGLEDAARIGVLAGLGILDAVAKANPRWAAEGKTEIDIRLGLHSGLVVVDKHLAVGDTVNIAARLEGLAPINRLVMSSYSAKLVQGWFETKSLGEHFLKGIAKAMEVFEVVGLSGVKSQIELSTERGLSPFIGREAEVLMLHKSWNRARNGAGQLTLLNGEAGIGKSRLVESMKNHVKEEANTSILELRCSAYHINSPFYPLIDLLERSLAFEEEETAESKLVKLEKWMKELGIPAKPNLPIFADFLLIPMEDSHKAEYELAHLSGRMRKKKFGEGFRNSFFNYAQKQPLLLIIEDLHWMDISSLEWLESMLEQVNTYPVFILCTTRPEFQVSWTGKSYTSQLNLQRLSHDRIEAIILHQSRGKRIPPSVLQQIKDKTDGIPLFVEELSRMIIESGILEEKEDQYILQTQYQSGIPDLAIPATLQDSLLARLDKLDAVRELIQIGAILGREFSFELMQAVSRKDAAELEAGLDQIVAAEFLYQKGAVPKAQYQFKHALIQDAAYSTLLRSNRQQWHHQIAVVLEEQFPHLSSAQPELLAYHLTEAGNTEKAIVKWKDAGILNIEGHAMLEATKHFRKSLELLESLEASSSLKEVELDLLLYLGGAIIHHKGYTNPELELIFSRTYKLCKETNQPKLLFVTFAMMLFYYRLRAEYPRAIEVSSEALELAKEEANDTMKVWALNEAGSINFLLGKTPIAYQYLLQAEESLDPDLESFLIAYGFPKADVYTQLFLGLYSLVLGYPDKSHAYMKKGLELTSEDKESAELHLVLNFLIIYHGFSQEWEEVKKYSEKMLSLARESGIVYWEMAGRLYLNWSLSRTGHAASAEILTETNQQFSSINQFSYKSFFLSFNIEAYLSFQEVNKAEEILQLAFKHIKSTGEGFCKSEIYRLKAESFLLQAKIEEAERYFQQSISIAKEQSAKWFELRAAKSLALLWQEKGKKREAYDLLNGVYSWFTEGFDKIDMKEAAVLLEELKES